MLVGVAIPPGLLVGTITAGAIELTGSAKALAAILGVIATFATVLGVVYGVRYRIAYEVERKAREGVEALADANAERVRGLAHERDDLIGKLDEARNELKDATAALVEARATIAKLEPLRDMGAALELVTESFNRLVQRQEAMHRENQQRFDRLEEVA
jgi:hypothetical protein